MELTESVLIITTIIAIYGAALSSYNVYQKWCENKPKIIVDFKYYCVGTETGEREEYYEIVAKNIGNKPVTMSHTYIEEFVKSDLSKTGNNEFINGKQIFSGQCIEVKYLYPDDFYPIVTPKNVDEIEVIGVFVDQIGNHYKSKPFVLV